MNINKKELSDLKSMAYLAVKANKSQQYAKTNLILSAISEHLNKIELKDMATHKTMLSRRMEENKCACGYKEPHECFCTKDGECFNYKLCSCPCHEENEANADLIRKYEYD